RVTLLAILGWTMSPDVAWNAYHALILLPRPPHMPSFEHSVPRAYIHRLVRLLGKARPRTRTIFLRLLSAISALHHMGATVQQWQWSLLIDAAGKGWRRIRLEDFRNALHVYADMTAGRAPGATFLHLGRPERQDGAQEPGRRPDIITFTTMLALAVKSGDDRALRHAAQLLAWSGLPPSAVTHTVMLSHFMRRKEGARVRSTLRRLHERANELGQVEFNSVLWAFASDGRLDVAQAMYQVVRARCVHHSEVHEAAWLAHLAKLEPHAVVPSDARPDTAVYHMMIQAHAYHGDLQGCLRVFTDMLSETTKDAGTDEFNSGTTPLYRPTLTAFRAIFLGFYRHGARPSITGPGGGQWTFERLEALFDRFLALPKTVRPKQTLFFWILMAYWRTGGRDAVRVQQAVRALEKRFGEHWSGRLARLRQMV
ncbi:hypothetical protein K488DRAFT_10461, partial [Vararia minispora EC-137]